MLSDNDGKRLLKLARDSITDEQISVDKYSDFDKVQGVFVTLHKHGQLRGCIGFPEPVYPLNQAVIKAARAAAFEDPRFPKLRPDEKIEIEISVLSVPVLIPPESDPLKIIKIGKHGLIIRTPFTSGLLLPQVFTDYDCTPKQALEMVSQKAGLEKEAWKDKSSKLFTFEAQIFSES